MPTTPVLGARGRVYVCNPSVGGQGWVYACKPSVGDRDIDSRSKNQALHSAREPASKCKVQWQWKALSILL